MSNEKSILTPLEQDLKNEVVLTAEKLKKYRVMIIRINGEYRENLTSTELYDVTRWCWKVSVERANKCDYVFAVYQRHIVAIYASPIWEKITEKNYKLAPDFCENPEQYIGRSFFTCEDYAKFDNSPLINKRVADEIFGSKGSANPILYNYELN